MSNRRKFDLDAARKAKAELSAEQAPIVVVNGKEYELPVSPPAGALIALTEIVHSEPAETREQQIEQSVRQAEGFRTALLGLFGPQAEEIIATGITLDEILEIMQNAWGDNGETDLPE